MIDRARHWDDCYRAVDADQLSWFRSEPGASLALIDRLGVGPDASVIDVGGGDSVLVDRLVSRGFTDVTVLDLSQVALDAARDRVGDAAHWLRADLLTWEPPRRWDLWHDRAAFHFLTEPADQATYRRLATSAVKPGGHLLLATFAADGPDTCSGLPVERYAPDRLAATIDGGFDLTLSQREEHVTPSGAVQPFTWAAFQRVPSSS